MSRNKLYAHVMLDRSGSMEACRDGTIDAFNEYVGGLRADPKLNARISLTIFDSIGIDLIHDRMRAAEMPKLTREIFNPRASTPLNDAIGKTVARIDREEHQADENVALVILTDGLENASVEYSKDAVKALLEGRQKDKNWLVIYLGANQDAWAEGATRGTSFGNTMDYNVKNTKEAMAAATRSSIVYAASASPAAAIFTPEERAGAKGR